MANYENIKDKGFDKHPEHINKKGKPKMPDLRQAIAEEIGDEGVREIIKAIKARAKKGDTKAAELILDRFYGKLKQEMDLNIPTEIVINLKKGGKGSK
jgi:uncharacterized protein YabE (DUF348 family)